MSIRLLWFTSTVTAYRHAEAILFCKADLSHNITSADLHNIVLCPYSIVIYVNHDPGRGPSFSATVFSMMRCPLFASSIVCSMRSSFWSWICSVLALVSGIAWSEDYSHAVPMREKGTATYFVVATIGEQVVDLLVDTGAGYATLNRNILQPLRDAGVARRSGSIEAVLANGQTVELPIYAISEMNLGGCIVKNVEVAQTPPNARNLLGLSVLRHTAPFSFSLEPAELRLSRCTEIVARSAGLAGE